MLSSNMKKIFLSAVCCVLALTSVFALKVPELTGPVVDNAKLLNEVSYRLLSDELTAISEQTGTQIAVLTIPTLDGLDIESYSMAVAEKWKLGSKEKDDGVLLCIAFAEKKIRIETGYGVEGNLTDTKCGLIIRNVIAPSFQRGDFNKGIVDAVHAIEGELGVGDVKPVTFSEGQSQNNGPAPGAIIILFILFYIFVVTGALSTKFPGLRWLPWAMLFGRPSSHHHYSNHHDDFFGGFGGGSSGGFGGGGFSGGGGGFGGGGASGGW